MDVENDYVLNRPQVAEEVARLFIKQVRLGTRYAVYSYSGELNLETTFSGELQR